MKNGLLGPVLMMPSFFLPQRTSAFTGGMVWKVIFTFSRTGLAPPAPAPARLSAAGRGASGQRRRQPRQRR